VLARTAPSAIIEQALDGRILGWSVGGIHLYGYEGAEIVGENSLSLYEPREVENGHAKAIFERALVAGKWEGRAYQVRRDGSGFWAQLTLLLRRDANGTPTGVVSVVRDLTDLEQLEVEVGRSRALGRALLESRAHILVMTDGFGTISEVNSLTAETFGETQEDLLDSSFPGRFVDPTQVEAIINSAFSQEEVNGFVLEVMLPDGQILALLGDAFLSETSVNDGGVLFALRALPSHSRKRRATRSAPPDSRPGSVVNARRPSSPWLRDSHTRALNVACESSAHLSHELRTPLTAVIGFAELMFSGQAGPMALAQREYLEDILASARHMLNLLNAELDSAKALAIEQRDVNRADLAELVRGVRSALRLAANEKQIDVTLEQHCDLSLPAETATKLRQILFNYLSNAIKFTPNGGRVTVRCHLTDTDYLCVEVRDTGLGLHKDSHTRLFQEFEQLDIPGELKAQGTGLGLAITRRLAQALGGDVEVSSTEGVGSTFSVRLPVNELDPQGAEGFPESATGLRAASPALRAAPNGKQGDRTLCA
jgi:PAS domain S-box-containing protein